MGLLNQGIDLAFKRGPIICQLVRLKFFKLNVGKTKELIKVVESYEYLGVHLDSTLNWKENTAVLSRKARLFFLRNLISFDISTKLLDAFYQGFLASVLFHSVLCWKGNISVDDKNRINKMIEKAGSVTGLMSRLIRGHCGEENKVKSWDARN